jgi:hypothetical protein
MSTRESGNISFFEKGVEDIFKKLEGNDSPEAEAYRLRADALRCNARKWTQETPIEDRKKATDDLFSLFRIVMESGNHH